MKIYWRLSECTYTLVLEHKGQKRQYWAEHEYKRVSDCCGADITRGSKQNICFKCRAQLANFNVHYCDSSQNIIDDFINDLNALQSTVIVSLIESQRATMMKYWDNEDHVNITRNEEKESYRKFETLEQGFNDELQTFINDVSVFV